MNQENEALTDRKRFTRRDLLRAAGAAAILGTTGAAVFRSGSGSAESMVWQIDPEKCTTCGRCATECVLTPSAAKCLHTVEICGFCDKCFGYFDPVSIDPSTAAEDVTCPYDAIQRKHVRDVHFEYQIDFDLCVGCGKCVEGCTKSGNGSFHLQLIRDICANCNQCRIADACPAGAIVRIPAEKQYLRKTPGQEKE